MEVVMLLRLLNQAVLVMSFVAVTGRAFACPICDSDTGDAVRAGIFDGSFGRHLAAMALPAGAVGAVVGVIHFGGSSARKGKRS